MTEFDPSVALQTSERISPRLTTEYLENHAVMPIALEGGKLLTATLVAEVDEKHISFRLIVAQSDVAMLIGRNGFYLINRN